MDHYALSTSRQLLLLVFWYEDKERLKKRRRSRSSSIETGIEVKKKRGPTALIPVKKSERMNKPQMSVHGKKRAM